MALVRVSQQPTVLDKDNAIRLLEECCAASVQDEDFAIGPQFAYQEIDDKKIHGFICFLTLPLPGPFRNIPSDPSPSKEAAKQSVAFMACSMLVELGVLCNVVVPIEIPDDDSEDEEKPDNWQRDIILIDSDEDDTPNIVNKNKKPTGGSVRPNDHSMRNRHPVLKDTHSFHLYAVSRTSVWGKELRDTCVLTTNELDILPSDGSSTVTLLDFAREVKVFHQRLVLTSSQLQRLKKFNNFILENVWMWGYSKVTEMNYLFAPVDLTAGAEVDKVINWHDLELQDFTRMQDFRQFLDRIGFLDTVAYIPSVMESLVAISRTKKTKAPTAAKTPKRTTAVIVAPRHQVPAEIRPSALENAQLEHATFVSFVFRKCLRATHFFSDNPLWGAGELTAAMDSDRRPRGDLKSLGTALKKDGLDAAVKAYRALYPKQDSFKCWADLDKNHRKWLRQCGDSTQTNLAEVHFPGRLRLESSFDYRFKDPWHFWHARHDGHRFQRLEFLGDAVLDYVVFEHYHRKFPKTHPCKIMALRVECVRNRTLSALALTWGLHEETTRSSEYHCAVKAAVREIKRMEALSPTKALEGKYWLPLKLPKALADQSEAFIGGIYADSGFDMEVMFRVVERMFAPFMDKYVVPLHLDLTDGINPEVPRPTLGRPSQTIHLGTIGKSQSTNPPCPKPPTTLPMHLATEPTTTITVGSLLPQKKGGIVKNTHSGVHAASAVSRVYALLGKAKKSAVPSKSCPVPLNVNGLVGSVGKSSKRKKWKNRRLLQGASGFAGGGLAHSSKGAGLATTSGCTALTQSALEKHDVLLGSTTGSNSSMVASGPTYEPPSDVIPKSFLWGGSKPSTPLSLLSTHALDFTNWRPPTAPAPAGSFIGPPELQQRSVSAFERTVHTPLGLRPVAETKSAATFSQGAPHYFEHSQGRLDVPWMPRAGPQADRSIGTVAAVGAFGSSLPTSGMSNSVGFHGFGKGGSTSNTHGFGSGLASTASFGFSEPFSYGVPSEPKDAPQMDKDGDIFMHEYRFSKE
ncbi:hypothetical protein EMPS_00369 [Entomortierella parvispora]|uniref:RNase III domain-containing protein n=1 Tax=Entomortierella parvispora TaxID=205924 RepID=A0A9P3H1J1_9FUNG|nr:hypothetical protein EMPS_00369 [Entomortierella parvispora]